MRQNIFYFHIITIIDIQFIFTCKQNSPPLPHVSDSYLFLYIPSLLLLFSSYIVPLIYLCLGKYYNKATRSECLMFPYFENYSQEIHLFDEFYCSQKPNASLGMSSNLVQTPAISDYNLGGEGDLFKAPQTVIGEPSIPLDPVTAAISMISCGDSVVCPPPLTVSDMDPSIDNGQLLSELYYECRKDILAKEGKVTPIAEVFDLKLKTDETFINERILSEGSFQKSVSSGCLRSMDTNPEAQPSPNFLDFPVLDFGAVYGIRRAFSEGDIKTLGNGDISTVRSPMEQHKVTPIGCIPEDRMEKLSRYRSKRSKRNFGRKVKYACRKALADSQPRIRGRFAKTEETGSFKKQ